MSRQTGAAPGPAAGTPCPHGFLDPLLSHISRRIMAITTGLVGLLAVAMTIATMIVAMGALGNETERALREASSAARTTLESGSLPDRGVASVRALPHRGSDPQSGVFVLSLRPDGSLVGDPAPLAGLPDQTAVAAARYSDDIRHGTYQDVDIRLITTRLDPPIVVGDEQIRYLQVGLITTIEAQQRRSLFLSLAVLAVLAMLGTALVAWVVTRRAMAPIRATFEHERRFVAEASHQLRTPLAILRSSAEVLGREDLVTPEGRPLVQDVIGEADRLACIVDDLHALAARQAAPPEAAEPVDAVGLVRATVERGRALGDARGVAVILDTIALDTAAASDAAAASDTRGVLDASDSFRVSGSRRGLEELLLVLIENAVRHSPDGGTVRLGVARTGSFVQLTVDDEGPGIAEADRERIFEPFARLDRDTGGSGLGLAIAREIVAQHGGRIEATASPSGGARLLVSLPVVH